LTGDRKLLFGILHGSIAKERTANGSEPPALLILDSSDLVAGLSGSDVDKRPETR
jgi:hypothetical protein